MWVTCTSSLSPLEALFVAALCLLVYPYLGYPAVLAALARLFGRQPLRGQALPSISLIISAHNEEEALSDKIRNCLELHYPHGRLEIMVASDGSTDRTDDITAGFSAQGVRLVRQEERRGKSACLNRAVSDATGDILVFTDANSVLDRDALLKLARNFADDEVGGVTGATLYFDAEEQSVGGLSRAYSALERFLKKRESRLASCVGADGAIFAMRRSLYTPLGESDLNDLVLPLRLVAAGKRVLLEEEAVCHEAASASLEDEFARQVRITNRTLRALFSNRQLLNPLRFPLFSFQLFSHKLLRFLTPVLLVAVLGLNVALCAAPLWRISLAAQFLCYTLAALGAAGLKLGAAPYGFVRLNLAMLAGWARYLRGREDTVWQPLPRSGFLTAAPGEMRGSIKR